MEMTLIFFNFGNTNNPKLLSNNPKQHRTTPNNPQTILKHPKQPSNNLTTNLHMQKAIILFLLIFSIQFLTAQENRSNFEWPNGKKAALSLSFDDARFSNVDVGVELFKKHNAQVTFYVLPNEMKERMEGWKQAVADGHEIGNHTLYHPCSGNFAWSRSKALETYNLASMRKELLEANLLIKELLGVEAVSFAYTCGQTFVGRGAETQSMVPLIDELFVSGRGWLNEASNDPHFVDLSQIQGIEMDGKDFEKEIKPLLDEAVENGKWVVLAGHEIGEGGFQTTQVSMLEELLAYVQQPNSDIWMAPVGTVTTYVKHQRTKEVLELTKALTFCATFDEGYDADLALGDHQIYTANGYGNLETSKPGMYIKEVELIKGKGRFGDALEFKKKVAPVLFYPSKGNVDYQEKDWSGTISLWLSLDPEKDLEPGYCDPVQITDVGYNDAALWVDFSDKNPRSFRMGVYGDLKVWNPDNISPDKNPDFEKRLLPAKDRPFGTDIWTHIVVSFSGLNAKEGKAVFYINGKYQGERVIKEPFTWELDKSKIFLGLNYVGLMDELAIFNRVLNEQEVNTLYLLPNGMEELLKVKN